MVGRLASQFVMFQPNFAGASALPVSRSPRFSHRSGFRDTWRDRSGSSTLPHNMISTCCVEQHKRALPLLFYPEILSSLHKKYRTMNHNPQHVRIAIWGRGILHTQLCKRKAERECEVGCTRSTKLQYRQACFKRLQNVINTGPMD